MTRDRWTSFLAVRVVREEPPEPDEAPPLLGSYRVAGDVIRFEPRFPLEPGSALPGRVRPGSAP